MSDLCQGCNNPKTKGSDSTKFNLAVGIPGDAIYLPICEDRRLCDGCREQLISLIACASSNVVRAWDKTGSEVSP